MLKGRPCGPLQSKKNPDAYTKPELVKLAVKKFKISESAANKMSKADICTSLSKGALTKVSIPKKVSVPKKVSESKKIVKKKVSTEPKASAPSKTIHKKSCIERSKLKPKEHQIRVIEHLKKHRGLIVGHEVGSGKTLTAVIASQCFLGDYAKGVVIVVTPVSLQDNFRKEMKAYGVRSSDLPRYKFYTLQGFAKEYHDKPCGTDKVPVMLIIDEAHNLRTDIASAKSAAKKRRSRLGSEPIIRADVAVRCAMTATKVVLLTATSVYNNPKDIGNLIAMARGTGTLSKRDFAKMLADDHLFKQYFSCILSFYDIPPDKENYPDVKEHYVEIPMSKKYYEEYQKVEDANSAFFDIKNPWRFLSGVRQASNALHECPKCDWVLGEVKKGKKMVIYSAFLTFGVEKMQALLKEHGIKYVEVTGKMKKADRTKAVERYNSNKVKVLFITKAGGEGLDLKETRTVVIFESSWNRATELQIIGRAVRYKSHVGLPAKERRVDVYHLIVVKPGPNATKTKPAAAKAKASKSLPSADVILRDLTESKELSNRAFVKKIKALSIENDRKCQ
jgi:superfamily II DNA or RNA helicase